MILDIATLLLLSIITYLAWKGKQEVESLEQEQGDMKDRLSTLEIVSAHYFGLLQDSIEEFDYNKEKGPQE